MHFHNLLLGLEFSSWLVNAVRVSVILFCYLCKILWVSMRLACGIMFNDGTKSIG